MCGGEWGSSVEKSSERVKHVDHEEDKVNVRVTVEWSGIASFDVVTTKPSNTTPFIGVDLLFISFSLLYFHLNFFFN